MDETPSIQIKGIREGLLINLESQDWENSYDQLFQLIKEKEAFFKEAQVCLDIGANSLRVKAITQLKDKLSDHGIKLWGIISTSELTENNAKTLGLQTALTVKKEARKVKRKLMKM
jgi:septum site-determining protein MinC